MSDVSWEKKSAHNLEQAKLLAEKLGDAAPLLDRIMIHINLAAVQSRLALVKATQRNAPDGY